MSTEYTPFLGVGLTFDVYSALIDFLDYYSLIDDIDPSKDDLECIAQECGVYIEYLGMYDIFFVGWKTESDSIWGLSQLLNTTNVRWQAKFLDHEPELVHLVNTY